MRWTCCATRTSTPSSARLVRTAASSGTSLMSILNDVLDHSKIEAGKMSLDARADFPALAWPIPRWPCSRPMRMRGTCPCASSSRRRRGLGRRRRPEAQAGHPQPGRQRDQVHRERRGGAVRVSRPAAGDCADVTFEVRDSGIGISPEAVEACSNRSTRPTARRIGAAAAPASAWPSASASPRRWERGSGSSPGRARARASGSRCA